MSDPVIPNIPSSIPEDQVDFFRSLKGCLEFMMGHGQFTDSERALRVGELSKFGVDINAFLKSSSLSPYPMVKNPSQTMPYAPTNLTITKGTYVHVLTWTNPSDIKASHVEVWAAENSQSIVDAEPIAIVTITEKQRGEQGIFKHSGFDVTSDFTYWIRAVSYAGKYSEWHPTLLQGGIAVAGDDSIAETISGVIDILRGGTPEIYDPETVYNFNDRCRDTDGRVWKSILVGQFYGHEPPNPVYWERTGILMVGDVDGTPTVAIDGNLVVDGTILARHLQAEIINATHIDASEIFVMNIQSSNYVSGVSGWKIGSDGTFELAAWGYPSDVTKINGGKIHAGSSIKIGDVDGTSDYCFIDDGDISFYKYFGGSHVLYKSLKAIEVGTASNNTTVTLTGIYYSEPFIFVVKAEMDSYIADRENQSIRQQIAAENITQYSTYRYQFTAICRTILSSGNDADTVNYSAAISGFSESVRTANTSLFTTAAGVTSLTVAGNYSGTCYVMTQVGDTGTYVARYGTVRIRVLVSIDGGAYQQAHDTGWVTNPSGSWSKAFSVSSGSHTVRCRLEVDMEKDPGWSFYSPWEGSASLLWQTISTNMSAATVLSTGTLRYLAIGV